MDQQTFKIWFAGFYEGEGTVGSDIGNRNRLYVAVSQNDLTPLLRAKEIWGGSVRKRVRKSPASDKICTGYEWRIRAKKSTELFFKDIEPFMIIPYKKDQLKRAREKSLEDWKGEFKCKFCDEKYSDPSGRRRHEVKEHTKKGKIFQCDLCERAYKSNDSMNRHKRLNHKSDASLQKGGEIPYNDGKPLRAQTTTHSLETDNDTRGNDLG